MLLFGFSVCFQVFIKINQVWQNEQSIWPSKGIEVDATERCCKYIRSTLGFHNNQEPSIKEWKRKQSRGSHCNSFHPTIWRRIFHRISQRFTSRFVSPLGSSYCEFFTSRHVTIRVCPELQSTNTNIRTMDILCFWILDLVDKKKFFQHPLQGSLNGQWYPRNQDVNLFDIRRSECSELIW